jgi:iron-sulfur cluster assembly protein
VEKAQKTLPIAITAKAQSKIIEIKAQKNISDDYSLRLGVKAAGCGIASYIIGFDHATDKDETYRLGKITVIVEKIQVMHLAGKTVDFDKIDGEEGFVFK